MGTRGLFGFYKKGKYYVVYNRFDSYPDCLGSDIVKELKEALKDGLACWIQLLTQIKVIHNFHDRPTRENIQILISRGILESTSELRNDPTWAEVLDNCKGSINKVLSSGYLLNQINDENGLPRWEEYAYIVNIDAKQLDFDDHGTRYSFDFDSLPEW